MTAFICRTERLIYKQSVSQGLVLRGARLEFIFYIRELSAFLGVVAFGNLLDRRRLGRRSLSVEDVHVKDNILAKSYPIKLKTDWRICD